MQYGIQSVSILGAKICDLLPGETKNSSPLFLFKNKIRKWISEKCLCKLCQTHIIPVIFDLSQTFARLAIVF